MMNPINLLTGRIVSGVLMTGMAVVLQVALAGSQATGGMDATRGGQLYKAEAQSLFRSDDGGKSWQAVPLPILAQDVEITAVSTAAMKSNVIYITGVNLGVRKSTDAGKSWVDVSGGLPSDDVTALTAHATEAETVYAVVADEGIFRSQDAGKSWDLMHTGPGAEVRRLVHSDMEGSMQTGWLFVATSEGVYRTMDCFCLFERAGDLSDPVTAVIYNPDTPAEIYAAVGQQVLRSARGGEEWVGAGQLSGEVIALSHAEGVLYALLNDGTLMQSKDAGARWE